MSTRLSVRIVGSAAQAIEQAAAWWLRHRTKAPEAFREELEKALELIATQPEIGALAKNSKLAGVRRILLGRIRYHLYYRVVGSPATIEVLALWHANRGKPPNC